MTLVASRFLLPDRHRQRAQGRRDPAPGAGQATARRAVPRRDGDRPRRAAAERLVGAADDRRFDLSAGQAGLGYVAVAVGMLVGRVVGDHTTDRLGLEPTRRGGAALAAVGVVIAATAPHPLLAGCGLFVAGLGLSSLFPLLFRRRASSPTARTAGWRRSRREPGRVPPGLAADGTGRRADVRRRRPGARRRRRRAAVAVSRLPRVAVTSSNPTADEKEGELDCRGSGATIGAVVSDSGTICTRPSSVRASTTRRPARSDTPSVRSSPPTSPSPRRPLGGGSVSRFCAAHRLPHAGVDPIDDARRCARHHPPRRPATTDPRDRRPRARRRAPRPDRRRGRRHRASRTRCSTSSSTSPGRSPRPARRRPGHRLGAPGRRPARRRRATAGSRPATSPTTPASSWSSGSCWTAGGRVVPPRPARGAAATVG